MGIKFECPNGHKLHVKSFLAGKKGLCPECGVKLEIPGREGSQGTAVNVTSAKPDAYSLQSGSSRNTPPPVVQSNSAANSEPEPEIQPAQECWYVRTPTGDQYGPATKVEFDAWVQQGRVGSDSLVWKEGWEQWRSASDVLKPIRRVVEAAPAVPLPNTRTDVVPPVANGSTPTIANSEPKANTLSDGGVIKIETNRALPRATSRTPVVVILLCLVCVLLLVPLIYLLMGSG